MNIRMTQIAAALAMLLPGAAALPQETDADTYPFEGHLSGAQEVVPPEAPTTPSLGVITQSAGAIDVDVAQDLSSLNFTLTVSAITGVTQAHLHCGRAGENGPIVLPLMPANDQGADANGVLAQGTLTNAEIVATAAGCEEVIGRPVRNIASLADAALDGLIYANVHTVTNPNGEIRGQLVSGGGSEEDDPGNRMPQLR